MFGSSIRLRIQIWHTFLLSTIVAGLLVAFYYHEKEILTGKIDQLLSDQLVPAMPHFTPVPRGSMPIEGREGRRTPSGAPPHRPPFDRSGPGDGFDRFHRAGPPRQPLNRESIEPRQGAEELKKKLIEQDIYLIAYGPNQEERDRTLNAPAERQHPQLPHQSGAENRSRTIDHYREYIHVGPRGNTIILGQSMDALDQQLNGLAIQLVATGAAITTLGFGIGWLLAGRALRPISNISKAANQIANGALSRRIDSEETESELGQLVKVLNGTFEKLEDTFAQQVRFTADASHELRTPIAVILAKCQFALRKEREIEKYRQTLVECEHSAQHLRGLVESLLQLSRVDSGEFALKKERQDLGSCAIECQRLLAPLADEKEISIKTDCPVTLCIFDKERMQQVITNLLSNAIKYTHRGGHLQVSLRDNDRHTELVIEDNGPGIEASKIPYLFDRFFRGDNDRMNEHRSTGLGLAIVKSIVDAHDGEIKVSSTVGQGSVFSIYLPK